MKQLQHVLFLVLMTIVPVAVNAQLIFNGNKGLNYVNSAWNLDPGFLTLKMYSRGFGTTKTVPSGGSQNIWDVNGRLNVNYGINKNIEVGLTSVFYEDTNNSGKKVNTPGDLLFTFKFASFGSATSPLRYGFLVGSKLPLAQTHNIPFEPYAANRVSFGGLALLSYSKDPLYPTEAMNLHLNIGYWSHNDVGVGFVSGGPTANSMTQEILYGIGVRIPKNKFKFGAEIYGNAFLQAPPATAYSRENYLYFSPSVHYKPSRLMSFTLGVDVRVLSSSDITLYAPAAGGIQRTLSGAQPNYAGWRINFGTHFSLLPSSIRQGNDRDILFKKAETRRQLFEKIIKEQRATESAEAELERIKAERIRAEKELERLRKILEGELKKDLDANSGKKEKNKNQ